MASSSRDALTPGRPSGHIGAGTTFNQERTAQNPAEVLTRLTLTLSLGARSHVVEPDQINILTSTVFRDLEQVQNAQESRLARQFRSNIWKPYWLNRIDLNLPFLHTVPRAYADVGSHPDSYAASDFSATDSFAKSFSEGHEESLRPRPRFSWAFFGCESVNEVLRGSTLLRQLRTKVEKCALSLSKVLQTNTCGQFTGKGGLTTSVEETYGGYPARTPGRGY
jgi:hypothetical protein